MAGTICNLYTLEQQMFSLTVPERKCACCEEVIAEPPEVIVYGQRVFVHERDNDYQESAHAVFVTGETAQ